MTDLSHRSCSTCIWWSELREDVNGLVESICEKSNKSTTGGDKCGQWKKLKWHDYSFGSKVKDYG